MPTLSQVLGALNLSNSKLREFASNVLLNEFNKSPSSLSPKILTFVASKLGDSSQTVRYRISDFLYNYAKSGRSLGRGWLYLVRYLGREDPDTKNVISKTFEYLDSRTESDVFKRILKGNYDVKLKQSVAEALAHSYIRKGYLSSLESLLEYKPLLPTIYKAVRESRRKNLLNESEYNTLISHVRRTASTHPKERIQKRYPRMRKPL